MIPIQNHDSFLDFGQYLLSDVSEEDFSTLIGLSKSNVYEFIDQRKASHESKPGRPLELNPCNEVLLFLLFLRHYPVELFLAVIFQTSQSTVNRTKERMLSWFYDLLKERLSFKSFEWRMDHAAKFFETFYTFIADGGE